MRIMFRFLLHPILSIILLIFINERWWLYCTNHVDKKTIFIGSLSIADWICCFLHSFRCAIACFVLSERRLKYSSNRLAPVRPSYMGHNLPLTSTWPLAKHDTSPEPCTRCCQLEQPEACFYDGIPCRSFAARRIKTQIIRKSNAWRRGLVTLAWLKPPVREGIMR
jgi:hypothetical protein